MDGHTRHSDEPAKAHRTETRRAVRLRGHLRFTPRCSEHVRDRHDRAKRAGGADPQPDAGYARSRRRGDVARQRGDRSRRPAWVPAPVPAQEMEAYPIGPLVSSAWNEGPELIEPVSISQ